MGNDVCIDLSLENIWQSWWKYKKGKKKSREFYIFQEYLEQNLFQLHQDLSNGIYQHGPYRRFMVNDNKRRMVSVAGMRDRVVHRLLYDYLVPLFDHTFIYDAWSCRKGKGLHGAIDRTQFFMRKYPKSYIWKADVQKFFDHVDHRVLFQILSRRAHSQKARQILWKVISSYAQGIPIGNLTSQIFANIYLNESDRYIKHQLKPTAYLRYGDDMLLFEEDEGRLAEMRSMVIAFMESELRLNLLDKADHFIRPREGLKHLGMVIYPKRVVLGTRVKKRIRSRLNLSNVASYWGMVRKYSESRSFIYPFIHRYDMI